MSNNVKIVIRVVVIVGLVAWPSVETFRLWQTAQQMKEAQALERKVAAKLDATRAKQAQIAHAPAPDATPAAGETSK
jgi:hypothetical protein